jgi:hypothetical protein
MLDSLCSLALLALLLAHAVLCCYLLHLPAWVDLLYKIQQKAYDEACFMPIWEFGFLCASGRRVSVSGLNLINPLAYSAPYEDVQLQST